jgi:glycoside/pentoside/hexuronide:cation symporter, GPH family
MDTSKVSVKEKIGFSLGEYSSSVVWQTLMFFLPFFYTDTFGLTAASVALMFGVVRIFDAFTDPIMGMIADRTNTRWGKFRPYILWLAIPYGIAIILMFTTPGFTDAGKIIWAYITYSFMMVIYTAIMIPYNSMIGVISTNPDERTSVSSYKFVFAYAAGFSVQLLIIPMVEKLGIGNAARGYQLTMGIFAVISVIFLLISFASVRERVKPEPGVVSNLKSDLKDLMGNTPWIILFLVSLSALVYIAIRSADIAYFFKYYLQLEGQMGTFMAVGTAFVLLGVVPTKWLASILGKKKLFIISLLIIAFSSFGFYFVGPNDIILVYTLQIIFSLASGPTMPLLWSMLADTADYSQWKNGRRATGLVYSAATFAQKSGFALGGIIVMGMLSTFGFIAEAEQSEQSVYGIRLAISIIPGLIALLAAFLMIFYKLDDKKVLNIEKELNNRRAKQAQEL